MSTSAVIARAYARKYQAGRVLTKTSIARDLITTGKDNEFIQNVIKAVFGEWWENRAINRVRKLILKK